MTTRRPSPILIPDTPDRSRQGGVRDWIVRVFGRPQPAPARPKRDWEDDGIRPGPAAVVEEPRAIHRPTIQMLPGRLEPLIPEVIQQEVRFQKAQGEKQEVTIGWEVGDPPHHVTLDHPSIQPLHAKMTYQKGNWMIESLAPNYPVEINGTPVPISAGPYLLAAGDQVRIGEALFRFFMP